MHNHEIMGPSNGPIVVTFRTSVAFSTEAIHGLIAQEICTDKVLRAVYSYNSSRLNLISNIGAGDQHTVSTCVCDSECMIVMKSCQYISY